jgi:ABC-2 type transport system ATP-binding protein
LFVFDEPTSGLDPLMQTEFFNLINEYVENGATCMLSTHILSEVKGYCKNVAIMKDGRLKCISKVSDILIEEPSLDEVFMHFYEN